MYTGVSSLVAAAAAVQRPLASEMVRLSGSLQSQPATEGMRAGLVRGKAVEGRAMPRMAKLRAWKAILGGGGRPRDTPPALAARLASWALRRWGSGLRTPVSRPS